MEITEPHKINYWVIPCLEYTKNVTHDMVINQIVKRKDITLEQLKSKCRKRNLVEARYLYAYIMKRKSKYTLEHIGRIINRDHSIIIYYCNSFEQISKYDKKLFNDYTNILSSIF